MFILRDRARERMSVHIREGERILSGLCADSREPDGDVGLELTNSGTMSLSCEIMT